MALTTFVLVACCAIAVLASHTDGVHGAAKPEWTVGNVVKFTPIPSVDCTSSPQSGYPFCNPSVSPEERATDLLSRLSTDEMIKQTSSIAPAIPRLGIKDYNWRSNCVHGWSASGGDWGNLVWTVFAAPMNLGATFNEPLVRQVGEATADEGRALHNVLLTQFNGSSTEAAGLNCFSPNVNLLRDPRWGRAMETFGEDPYVLSVIGAAYTKGLQVGSDPKYVKVGACAKHYAVHSGPEELRLVFRADASLHDLYDTYLPAFKSQVVGANVTQMMPAYSGMRCKYQPDGAPDAANTFLLKTVLRGEFGAPNISVISDNGGVDDVFATHKYVSSKELAAAVCITATTDLDLGHDDIFSDYLPSALVDGDVTLQLIKDAVWRSFFFRFRVGDFDPPSMVPYQLIDGSHLNTVQNQQLNLRAARESIVLLKNSDNSLPLSSEKISKLAILGPNANATETLLANYQGIPSKIVSLLEGIQTSVKGTVVYNSGCASVKCPDTTGFAAASNAAKGADYVIMVMGLDHTIEGEGQDRLNTTCEGTPVDNLALPGCQTKLVEAILGVSQHVILILVNGGPVSIPNLYPNKGIVGILEAFYPGALGGQAVADVLFGKYNPGGKMPVTVFSSVSDVPFNTNYDLSYPPGRTYRYFTGQPLIPFGYGLSYTQFSYDKLTISSNDIKPCEPLKVTVSVGNTGDLEGDEVIQVYLRPPKIAGKAFMPLVELLGFTRVTIKASGTGVATFELNPYLLSLVDEDGKRYIFPGSYTIQAGGEGYVGGSNSPTANFAISGAVTAVDKCAGAPKCLAC